MFNHFISFLSFYFRLTIWFVISLHGRGIYIFVISSHVDINVAVHLSLPYTMARAAWAQHLPTIF